MWVEALGVRIQSSGAVPSLWGSEGQPMPAHVTAEAPRGLATSPTQDRTGLSRAAQNLTKGSVSSFTQSSLLIGSFMCSHLLELLIYLGLFTPYYGDFPGGSVVKICLQCRRPGFAPWVGKIPWSRAWQPTPVFCPGEFHGQPKRLRSMGLQRFVHD